jgi:hypothetical protein
VRLRSVEIYNIVANTVHSTVAIHSTVAYARFKLLGLDRTVERDPNSGYCSCSADTSPPKSTIYIFAKKLSIKIKLTENSLIGPLSSFVPQAYAAGGSGGQCMSCVRWSAFEYFHTMIVGCKL